MEFEEYCKEIKKEVFSFSDPLLIHHYDADGISSGAIVKKAFLDNNKKLRLMYAKKIDERLIDKIKNEKEIIFVDLGNSELVEELKDVIIIDHHQMKKINKKQINPEQFGIDGGKEMSGASLCAFVFDTFHEFGIVGAIGDMQYPIIGKNRELLEKTINLGKIIKEIDLAFYGRNAYPIVQFLAYNDYPYVPSISYNEENVKNLLSKLNIPLKDEKGNWRRWVDLFFDEKRKIISSLVKILNSYNLNYHIVGEVFSFKNEEKQSPFYDLHQFATILNACGRHDKADLGIKVCFGQNREEAYKMLEYHRKKIKEGIEFANQHLVDMGPYLLLDGRKKIDEGIIGIVCGISLKQYKKPLLGIAESKDGLKISVRTKSKHDLSKIISETAKEVGGYGGGHKKAAGATIQKEKLNEFLLIFGEKVWTMK